MEMLIRSALIRRLGLDEEAHTVENAIFVLRYESQDAEDRRYLHWPELIRELVEQAKLHGVEDVLEAAHIQKQMP